MPNEWAPLWIDVGYACFWVEVDRGTGAVADAPPIARWMIGKHYYTIFAWVGGKGGDIHWVEEKHVHQEA